MSSDLDERFDDEPPSDSRGYREAKAAVGLPAILLIVIGALGIFQAIVGIVQLSSLPGQFDQMIAKIDADPNQTREQKDTQIQVFNFAKDFFQQPIAVILYVVSVVLSLIIILGGIRMLQLSGPALPTISAVLSMIHCSVGCCCIPGLPVGIYALIIVSRPYVRIAMASRNASPQSADDSEMR
jgi:hypothetical protein